MKYASILLFIALCSSCKPNKADVGFVFWVANGEKIMLGESEGSIRKKFPGLEECYFQVGSLDCLTYLDSFREGDLKVVCDLNFHFDENELARIDAKYSFAANDTQTFKLLNRDIFQKYGVTKSAGAHSWDYQNDKMGISYYLNRDETIRDRYKCWVTMSLHPFYEMD